MKINVAFDGLDYSKKDNFLEIRADFEPPERFHWHGTPFLMMIDGRFRFISVADATAQDEPFIYPIELTGSVRTLWNSFNRRPFVLLERVDPRIVEASRRGQCTIVVNLSMEGFNLDTLIDGRRYWYFDFIQNLVKAHGIPPQRVAFIHGNLASLAEHEEWRRTRALAPADAVGCYVVCISQDYVRDMHALRARGMDLRFENGLVDVRRTRVDVFPDQRPLADLFVAPEELDAVDTEPPATRRFLCFNRGTGGRPHRKTFAAFLHAANLLEATHFSFLQSDVQEGFAPFRPEDPEWPTLQRAWDALRPKLPMYVDYDPRIDAIEGGATFLFAYRPTAWPYRDSAISLVTETTMSNPKIQFLTEKTFKPIVNCHPFLVFGGPFTLRHLVAMGYRTFSPEFDERYDEEEDPRARARALFAEIERLGALPAGEIAAMRRRLAPILRHNRATLLASRSQFYDAIMYAQSRGGPTRP